MYSSDDLATLDEYYDTMWANYRKVHFHPDYDAPVIMQLVKTFMKLNLA